MADQDPKEEAFHLKGDRLGKFRLLAELGRGSMGVVYRAFQEGINREVALKILPANITLDKKAVKRFHREAEAVGRLSHPNIIQIYDNGTIEGTHYFAMELVEGKDFSDVRCRDRESILDAARLLKDAAVALAHAHAAGVIHRDIKPSNIMLDKSGRVVVTDFGLARIKDSASLTSTDAVVGTPKYMSPEQVLPGSHPIDGRVDVYALGATLYECITGQPPLDAPSVQAFFKAIIEQRPSSPRRINRLCPHDLATITLRCLEKNPNDRYASAQALADDLDRFVKGERIEARPKGMLALGLESVRRHKVIASLSVLAAIALLAVGFLGGEVKKLQERTGREIGLFSSLAEIRAESDLGFAANEAYELAEQYPDNAAVKKLLTDVHVRLAEAALNEPTPNWNLVLNYMRRAGQTEALWYLMGLMEIGRDTEARAAAEKLNPDTEPAYLTRARLDLSRGKPEEALAELTGRSEKLHPFCLLVVSWARRALAAKETDTTEARRHLEQAREVLLEARASVRVRWLRFQIQYEEWEVKRRLGESVSLRDSVDDISLIANEWWGQIASVWEGMTAKQADNLKVYVARILEFGGMPSQTVAAEIEARARERLKQDDAHEKLIAYLMLAVAHLSSRELEKARETIDAAAEQLEGRDDPLEPYVYWGKSFIQRARGDLIQATVNAQSAVEFAVLEQATFKDMEALARHTALLAEDAHQLKQGRENASSVLKTELAKLKDPGAWVSEILARIARLASAPSD